MNGSTEQLEIVLGGLVLASPVLVGVALCVWTHRMTARGRPGYAPLALAAVVTGGGVVLASTAPSGLEGLGEALLGAYLAGLGGLTTLVCAAIIGIRRLRGAPAQDGDAPGSTNRGPRGTDHHPR